MSVKIGFSTFFFSNITVRDAIDRIAGIGVDAIELMYDLPHLDQFDQRLFSRIEELTGQGIRFSLHGPLFEVNLGSLFTDFRRFSLERFRAAIDAAAQMGCRTVVIHPGYSLLAERAVETARKTRNNFYTDLNVLATYAADRKITLGLENIHMPYFFFHDVGEFLAIKERVPSLGMTLDVGHAFVTKCQQGERDPEGAILKDIENAGIENLVHVHLHNNDGAKDDHLLFDGRIDLDRIVSGLLSLGYGGTIIIETYDMEHHNPLALRHKVAHLKTVDKVSPR